VWNSYETGQKEEMTIKINRQQAFEAFWMGHYDHYIDPELFGKVKQSFLNKKDERDSFVRKVLDVVSQMKKPVAVLMSGGVDSTFMLTMALECFESEDVKPVTVGFVEPEYDESFQATQTARLLGLDHYIMKIGPSFARRFFDRLSDFNCDSLFFSSSVVPTFAAMEFAGGLDCGSILTGDGGDELFCGYDRYRVMDRICFWPMWLRKGISILVPVGSERNRKLKETLRNGYEGSIRIWPLSWVKRLIEGVAPTGYFNYETVQACILLDMSTQLYGVEVQKVKMAGKMAIALPVVSPFLEEEAMLSACSLPLRHKVGKRLLMDLIREKHDFRASKKKRGFAIPIGEWFRDELRTFVDHHLLRSTDKYLDQAVIKRTWEEHLSGIDHAQRIWSLLYWRVLLDKGLLELE